jgi:hypothetical protein
VRVQSDVWKPTAAAEQERLPFDDEMNARRLSPVTAVAAIFIVACGSSDASSPSSMDGGARDASIDVSTSVDARADATEAASCASASLYVGPTGAGTACSCAAPCSLETGRDKARAIAATSTSDVIVLLEGGAYRLTETFALTAADSGVGGHAIVYRAAPGPPPLLSGAIAVSGFAPVDGSPGTWVASVPAGTQSRQLYVNGRRATRARGPALPAGYTQTSTGFTLGDAPVATWPDRANLEIVGFKQWKMFRCPVTDVSAAGVVVADPCWTSSQLQAGYVFDTVQWIENALELLDEGGEFYLDETAAKLYYMPRAGEDLTTADVELPIVEQLVAGTGDPSAPIHDVTFDGITFAYGTWLAPSTPDGYAPVQASMTYRGSPSALEKPLANVMMHAAHTVTFDSCQFLHMGGVALAFEVGAQANVVTNSRFEDISSSAVMIGDVNHPADYQVTDPTLIVKDNSVTGSYVTRAGAEYYDACGIFVGYATHSTVANSELFDLPYTGISAGWGWGGTPQPSSSRGNDFHQNLISNHMRALFDGGAIYLNGQQPGTTMVGNVVSNQAAATGNLYLDNGTQGVMASNNVVFVDAKADIALPDPNRGYWVYVQVYPTIATNNSVTASFTNDPTMLTPMPIDPSNTVSTPTDISTNVAPAASFIAAAGSPLRSPEVAQGKAATASSVYDTSHIEAAGNDGNAFDGWSPSGTDTQPWWQVDLGGEFAIDAVEVVSRWAIDQAVTRRSYEIVASDDPAFATSTTLGSVDATGIPHQAIFASDVSPPVMARYVRVRKTVSEYFFLGEVRVHGTATP